LDNVSHTVAGLLLAEAAIQYRLRRAEALSPRFARAALWISALANNLPDFDFLYSRITEPRTLGYLVHHRGHTHTLLVALLLSALLVGGMQWRMRSDFSRREWAWLWALGLFGGGAHIAMDFANNYGVHPFWPLYAGWFYGDLIFIIEPLFFVLCVPPLLASLRSLWLRITFALVLAGILVLGWLLPWMPFVVALLISAIALLWLFVSFKLDPARRVALTFAACALVVLVFGGTRFLARGSALSSLPAAAALQDVVLTPMPANPLCWSVWRVSARAGHYVAERGVVASFPGLLSADRCQVEPTEGAPTAPITALDVRESAALRWTGRYTTPVRELAQLDRESCFAAVFFRYARVPYWTELEGQTIVGDLRYDRAPQVEFAEFALPPLAEPCPRWVPDWTPPREELLRRSDGLP
jgi:inner membrane protein